METSGKLTTNTYHSSAAKEMVLLISDSDKKGARLLFSGKRLSDSVLSSGGFQRASVQVELKSALQKNTSYAAPCISTKL